MRRLIEQNFLIRKNLMFILGLCLCLYFSYHTLQGERSLPHMISLNKVIEKKQAEYETLKTKREALEQRVVMLRPNSLNADFLEERARIVLGLRREGEMMIVQN